MHLFLFVFHVQWCFACMDIYVRVLGILELELQRVVSCLLWLLRTELQSSARAVLTPNHWTIFLWHLQLFSDICSDCQQITAQVELLWSRILSTIKIKKNNHVEFHL